ncbi:MAG: ABC transporter transmembrane domain-containing protein, partial [Planctomycetota bacterium]
MLRREANAVTESPVFRRMLGLLRPHRGLVAGGLGLLLLSVPCELVPGAAALYLVDDLITPFLTDATPGEAHPWLHAVVSLGGTLTTWPALLASVLVWMAVIALLGTAFKAASTNLMERAAQKLILDLRRDVYDKLQHQSLGYLHRQRTGDLMSRSIGDVDQVQQFI